MNSRSARPTPSSPVSATAAPTSPGYFEARGVGRSAAYEAARRGEIPCRRLGRRVIVPVPALLEWLGVSTPAA